MGIKDLNQFLDNTLKFPRTRQIKLNTFAGRIIAVDAHQWAYTNMAIANKVVTELTNVGSQDPDRDAILQHWFSSALESVCLFLAHGVTPVYVFDGDHIPEKAKTQDKRRENKTKDLQEIEKLKEELRATSPFDRNQDRIKRLKQLMSRCNYIARDDFERLKNLLLGLGIPVLQSLGEGEQLCASMAREGLVAAVFSTDTDVLVYGCPLMISSLDGKYYDEAEGRMFREATCVYLPEVLEDLKWDQETFIEFCITLGCDFNQRIRGLGPKTAYKLIQEYGSIDSFPERYSLDSLNYKKCRKIFRHRPPFQVIEGDEFPVSSETLQIDRSLLFRQGEEVLSDYSATNYLGRLKSLMSTLPSGPASGMIPVIPRRQRIIILRKPKETSTSSEPKCNIPC